MLFRSIQWGTSYVYPTSSMGAHVSAVPNHQVGRMAPLSTRAAVAFWGAFGYELDPTALTDAERAEVREQIAWYKARRGLIQQIGERVREHAVERSVELGLDELGPGQRGVGMGPVEDGHGGLARGRRSRHELRSPNARRKRTGRTDRGRRAVDPQTTATIDRIDHNQLTRQISTATSHWKIRHWKIFCTAGRREQHEGSHKPAKRKSVHHRISEATLLLSANFSTGTSIF